MQAPWADGGPEGGRAADGVQGRHPSAHRRQARLPRAELPRRPGHHRRLSGEREEMQERLAQLKASLGLST